MAISYPLSLPSNKIAQITISSNAAVAISTSPFSFVSTVQKFSGQMWLAQIALPPMVRADAEPWETFLLKLNGSQGTFLLGDPSATTPRGVATGTPVVSGGSQTGQSLVTSGWTNSVTGILKAGDYIQIGQRLYKNLSDVDSNGSGQATLDIWPRLRESPSNGATIITGNCLGLFRLDKNNVRIADVGANKIYNISFTAQEAL